MKQLDDSNFLLYAAKHYDNPQCYDTDEFYEDLNRFKYLKRLFSKYKETGELKERLILNHLIVLYNVFGVHVTTRLLFFRLNEYREYLKTFLVYLNYMPDIVHAIGKNNENILNDDIILDAGIVNRLRNIDNG